ncbi:MAG: hypothetical protein KF696_02915 [Planctomycetes bacterium]|nr:hypothetical protein [Planctomycetota bacterium]MCW8134956.1 hypothetical protein [Planctomycetota bacterium]
MRTHTARLRILSTTLPMAMLAALMLLLLAVPTPTVEAQDDFKSLRKEYEQARKDGARTTMGRVVHKIAETNDPDAAKFLLKELDDDQKARARKRAGLPGEVRGEIIKALSKFNDEKSVELIGNAALALKSDKDPVLALDQYDFFLALAGMKNSPPADKALRAAIADAKNPFIKVAAIEAARQAVAKQFANDVAAVLAETNEEWHKKWLIVPINVFACLEMLVEPEDTKAAIAVVKAVIEWQERTNCADERVRYFGGKMLAHVTGEEADMASTFYWKWWVAQMETVGNVANANKPEGKRSKTAATPPVFDTQPVGKRFVFVVDLSDSMKLPLKITLEEIEKRKRERGPVSGKRKKEKDAEGDDKDPEDNNPLRKLPWKDITTKFELAREELSRAIKDFAGDRWFAVILYGTQHSLFTEGWIQATRENCDKWSRKVKEIDFMGMTNIHGALLRALRMNKGGDGDKVEHPAVDPDCVLNGADCIVFMTDGWGSWDDQSQNRTKDKRNNIDNSVGDGPFIYGEDIWPDILRHNIFRKVVINCVGIGNHDKDLLKNLASRSGGTYVDWGFPE